MEAYFDYDKVTGLSNALGGRVDLLEKVLGLKARENLKYSDIQKIAASGLANEFFDIGDEIIVPWTDYSVDPPVTYEVPHVIVHFGDAEDSDGNIHKNAMWLMWKYTTPNAVSFDGPEIIEATEETFQEGWYYYTQGSPAYNEESVVYGSEIPNDKTYYKHRLPHMGYMIFAGSSIWEQSAYRQWLNSDAAIGEWWTPQHECDVAPTELNTLPGFLTGYSNDWLNIIKPFAVHTVDTDYSLGGNYKDNIAITYDKFFIPSTEQMYGVPKYYGRSKQYLEDGQWDYFKKNVGTIFPTNDPTNARKFCYVVDKVTAKLVRLRSMSESNIYAGVTCCTSGNYPGEIVNLGASASYRTLPSCVIY